MVTILYASYVELQGMAEQEATNVVPCGPMQRYRILVSSLSATKPHERAWRMVPFVTHADCARVGLLMQLAWEHTGTGMHTNCRLQASSLRIYAAS